MVTFITYCLTQQKLNISRYMMTLWKNRIAKESLIFLRSRVEVYPLNEVKLVREVLTQKVNFNPAPQKIEDLPAQFCLFRASLYTWICLIFAASDDM